MWPFKKKPAPEHVPTEMISFSQVDTTEGYADNEALQENDWIATTPLNAQMPDGESMGLPPQRASDDAVYAIADRLSELRESLPMPGDGVYCPICHIANINLARLRTPCPKCGRALLKFGWT